MSLGFCSFLFGGALVAFFILVQMTAMTGWTVGTALLTSLWLCTAYFGWADPALLAVEAIALMIVVGMALRWTLRHQAWQKRISKDRAETDQKQADVQTHIQQLKEKMGVRSAEIDKGLKQYELVRRLAESVSWEEMSPSLEKAMKHFFRTEGWALYLTNEKGELQSVQRRGYTPPLSVEDLPHKEPYIQRVVATEGSEKGRKIPILGLPLWRLHERIGLLLMRVPDLPETEISILLADAAAFSTQLIFAMAKAKLFRELDQRSRTDGLTGLSRRAPFEERLREEVARAQAFKTTFSILMIDIDHFKNLNDTYGHQIGDEVLKTVSQRLREGLYETDMIARFGGEEFVCLMPRSIPAGLKIKADQIRQRVADHSFVVGVEPITVTVSIGIAHFPQDGTTGHDILEAADRALYAAKAAGRNCVIEASSVPRP